MPNSKQVVTISKLELNRLKRKAQAYEKLAASIFDLRAPINEIVTDFKMTGLYSKGFIKDLKAGLQKSSWKSNR